MTCSDIFRWIPVDESLPPDDGNHYQVKLSTKWSVFYRYQNGKWIDRWNIAHDAPVAWRNVTDE